MRRRNLVGQLHIDNCATAQAAELRSRADGVDYTVHGYEYLARDESIVAGLDHCEPTGVFEYRLADGGQIDVAADGSMRIATTGVALSAKKPAAA